MEPSRSFFYLAIRTPLHSPLGQLTFTTSLLSSVFAVQERANLGRLLPRPVLFAAHSATYRTESIPRRAAATAEQEQKVISDQSTERHELLR